MNVNDHSTITKKLKSMKESIQQIHFGELVDLFHDLMVIQVLLSFLFIIYFKRYQMGVGRFQPIVYFSMLMLPIFFFFIERIILQMSHIAMCKAIVSLLYLVLVPIQGEKRWMAIVVLLFLIGSLFSHRYGNSPQARYAARFRLSRRRVLWGALIVFLFFAQNATVLSPTPDFPVSPDLCNQCFIISFEIYIVSAIMMQYAFSFYDFFRQNQTSDRKTVRQLKHSFLMILSVLSFFMTLLFFIFGKILLPLFTKVAGKIVYFFLSLFVEVFNSALSEQNIVKKSLTGAGNLGVNEAVSKVSKAGSNSSQASSIGMMLLLALICFAVWKLYQKILANYKIGTDEAEFIPIHKEKEIYVDKTSKWGTKIIFGNSNVDKIRKYYYKTILRKKKKCNVSFENGHTPKELAVMLGQGEKEKEQLQELTDIYEKARYSGEESNDQEVEESRTISEKFN